MDDGSNLTTELDSDKGLDVSNNDDSNNDTNTSGTVEPANIVEH